MFGKQVHEECLEFGERVLWRKYRAKDMNVVWGARRAEGVWLGRRWSTTHPTVSGVFGMHSSRSVGKPSAALR